MFNPNSNADFGFGGGGGSSGGGARAAQLPDDQLRNAITTRGTVAVVRVTDTVVRAEGSEEVSISVSVEKPIWGRALQQLHRPGRYPGVQRGLRYVVAVSGTGELLGFVQVTDVERSVDAHRRVVERLGGR